MLLITIPTVEPVFSLSHTLLNLEHKADKLGQTDLGNNENSAGAIFMKNHRIGPSLKSFMWKQF